MVDKVDNPRFPHQVNVVRDMNTGTNAMPKIEEKTILQSKCRNYLSSTRGREKSEVSVSEYTISLPRHTVHIQPGDKVIVHDVTGVIKGTVVAAQVNNLGANIYYNSVKN